MRHPMRAAAVVLIVVGSLATSCGDDGGFVIGSTTTPETTALSTTTVPPPTPTTGPSPATTVTTSPPPTAGTTQPAPTTSTVDPPPTPLPGTLDPTATAYYAEFALESGFSGDPWASDTTNAGSTDPVDVGYLGGPCVGWANDIPDFELTYESSGFTAAVLRFFFIPDDPAEDTVLIVNATDGSWHCGDDSYGSVNPTVDFPNPSYGVYDIWLGTYEEGVLVAGTLYITEADENHP
jgi:serine protease Do